MKKPLSKSEAKKEIEEFFSNLKGKTPKDIKKIKRIAASYKIPLKDKRKSFCKKCLSVYEFPKTRIKRGKKIVECKNCKHVTRYNIK